MTTLHPIMPPLELAFVELARVRKRDARRKKIEEVARTIRFVLAIGILSCATMGAIWTVWQHARR